MPRAIRAGRQAALVEDAAQAKIVGMPVVGPAQRQTLSVGFVVAREGRTIFADHVAFARRFDPPQRRGMPGIPTDLWGASPLYENETLCRKAVYQM